MNEIMRDMPINEARGRGKENTCRIAEFPKLFHTIGQKPQNKRKIEKKYLKKKNYYVQQASTPVNSLKQGLSEAWIHPLK